MSSKPELKVYPCDYLNGRQAPGLYTFYAMASLLVVILAISLIWIPFVQLITETNTIITRMVIYFNTELLGFKNTSFHNVLQVMFLSQESLILLAGFGVLYGLYLASSDFLLFANCYVCNLPNAKCLEKLKLVALRVIDYLLNLTGKKELYMGGQNISINYHDRHR